MLTQPLGFRKQHQRAFYRSFGFVFSELNGTQYVRHCSSVVLAFTPYFSSNSGFWRAAGIGNEDLATAKHAGVDGKCTRTE